MGAGELSYVHGACETPLLSDTIGQRLDRTAETWPGRPALIDRGQGVRWNWTELREQVDRLAAGFLALGLRRGERVGIWSLNRVEWA
ncbi:AMP-binding protein, partial [Roseomonas sp. DSM 102946]|nr:AMP-binding protein [Roseomonas sp. DSM 102946]